MTEGITLGEFERRHGVHKGTVSKRAREMGFDTSAGLSPDAYEAMKQEFGVKASPTEPTAPAPGAMTIDVGNHRGQMSLPQPPSGIDLGKYRGENAALSTFAPEDIDRFLLACDGFVDAVNADYQHQQAVTAHKEQAVAKVRSKVAEVKQASLLYQVRSETLALHNRGLDTELTEGMELLGKPTAGTEA